MLSFSNVKKLQNFPGGKVEKLTNKPVQLCDESRIKWLIMSQANECFIKSSLLSGYFLS